MVKMRTDCAPRHSVPAAADITYEENDKVLVEERIKLAIALGNGLNRTLLMGETVTKSLFVFVIQGTIQAVLTKLFRSTDIYTRNSRHIFTSLKFPKELIVSEMPLIDYEQK